MQLAYKPALAVNPAQNLLMQSGHTCVLWSPEKLNLSHKQVGIQMVEARHFVLFTDQAFPGRDESETIFTADLTAERGIVQQLKTAYACAYEVIIQHAARGVVILESFIDVPPAKIEALENKLSQLGWFEVEKIPDLRGILEQIQPSDEIERQAIDDLRNAVETTINYRMARLDDAIGESQRAREGNMGRASLTRQERAYYEEIGLELPESITQSPIAQQAEQVAPQMDMSAIQAMVAVFSEAMNNHTEKLVAQLKGGQANEEKGSETASSKGRKASKEVVGAEEKQAA